MTDNIHILPVITCLDVSVDRVKKASEDAKLEAMVVIGFDKDGQFYFSSSKADGGTVLWLMEMAKKRLLEV